MSCCGLFVGTLDDLHSRRCSRSGHRTHIYAEIDHIPLVVVGFHGMG